MSATPTATRSVPKAWIDTAHDALRQADEAAASRTHALAALGQRDFEAKDVWMRRAMNHDAAAYAASLDLAELILASQGYEPDRRA